jgi:hypothetical protein
MSDIEKLAGEYAEKVAAFRMGSRRATKVDYLAGAAARQSEVDALRQALSDLYGLLPVHMGEVQDDKYHLITNAAALIEVKS